MNKIIFVIISIFFSFPAYADMSDANKTKALVLLASLISA